MPVGVSSHHCHGASVIQQCLKAGLLDDIYIDLVPVLLGAGIRLFDHFGTEPFELESTRVVAGSGVTHLHFRETVDAAGRSARVNGRRAMAKPSPSCARRLRMDAAPFGVHVGGGLRTGAGECQGAVSSRPG
jgi:hypothetical protein